MTESIENCARAILETVPAVIQAIRVEMRQKRLHDLSVPQFRTLAYIARHPGCSLSDVAEFIGLTLPTMSVLVNGLVEDGYVLRQTSLLDRRRVTLTLTEAGASVHAFALEGALDSLVRRLEPLSTPERQSIIQAMQLLSALFDASGAAAARGETAKA